jgi:hypothetical protein
VVREIAKIVFVVSVASCAPPPGGNPRTVSSAGLEASIGDEGDGVYVVFDVATTRESQMEERQLRGCNDDYVIKCVTIPPPPPPPPPVVAPDGEIDDIEWAIDNRPSPGNVVLTVMSARRWSRSDGQWTDLDAATVPASFMIVPEDLVTTQ